jgi:hypothetical protein
MPYSILERMLLAALRQAAHEHRLDVAEHILRALEVVGRSVSDRRSGAYSICI